MAQARASVLHSPQTSISPRCAFSSGRLQPRYLQRRSAARMGPIANSTAADTLFVATNNFKVKPEYAEDFENMWKNRESRLNECPGFVRFALLRCDQPGEYVSQTYWASRGDFENWTKSQQFAKAHGGVSKKSEEASKKPSTMEMLQGPPQVKLYEAVTVTEKEA